MSVSVQNSYLWPVSPLTKKDREGRDRV